MSEQYINIAIVATVTSFISLVATLLIVYIYVRYEQMRQNISFRMIAFLCFADALWEVIHIISLYRLFTNDKPDSQLCTGLGMLTTFSRLAIISWTTAIAYAVFTNQVQGKQIDDLADQEGMLQLFCFLIPFVAAWTYKTSPSFFTVFDLLLF